MVAAAAVVAAADLPHQPVEPALLAACGLNREGGIIYIILKLFLSLLFFSRLV